MKISVKMQSALEVPADLLILGAYADQGLTGILDKVNQSLAGALADAMSGNEFEAKFLQVWSTASLQLLPHKRVFVVGMGQKNQMTAARLREAAGKIAQFVQEQNVRSIALQLPFGVESPNIALQAIAEGLELGQWKFVGYKRHVPEKTVVDVTLSGVANEEESSNAVELGQRVAQAQNLARELGFRPSNFLYPQKLAEAAVEAGKTHGFSVEVFDEKKLEELGMGGLLGVGQGSAFPPRLVIMRYQAGSDKTLGLVGKGITFDSGGISLKPGQGMEDMKYDMLGAAAVLGAMCAIAESKPAINVVGLMAIAQNMPSGIAYKPGDVVKTFNGKTIEIINTDAEGRVVLSDAVSYAEHLGVDWIVETSTLTGAAVVVLGHEASALVSPDDNLAGQVIAAGDTVGERIWRLPIYPEYRELYKSDVADMKNSPGRAAGTITAGMIISEFVEKTPFAHIDIAGTAWTKKSNLNALAGPTGVMVRTFNQLAHSLGKK